MKVMIESKLLILRKREAGRVRVYENYEKRRTEQMSKEQGTGEQGSEYVYQLPKPVHLFNITSFSAFYNAS
jgi:hypothetical protein